MLVGLNDFEFSFDWYCNWNKIRVGDHFDIIIVIFIEKYTEMIMVWYLPPLQYEN